MSFSAKIIDLVVNLTFINVTKNLLELSKYSLLHTDNALESLYKSRVNNWRCPLFVIFGLIDTEFSFVFSPFTSTTASYILALSLDVISIFLFSGSGINNKRMKVLLLSSFPSYFSLLVLTLLSVPPPIFSNLTGLY